VSASNVYDDPERARAYAQLQFPGTYYLAFRDLSALFHRHVRGTHALDFGCGTGRSTRFLKSLGFDVVGVDIAAAMIEMAKAADTGGRYEQVSSGDFTSLGDARFDLVLSAFAFDNIPGHGERVELFRGIRHLLAPEGRFVLLGSTPDIYTHEWASFTTRDFPENGSATSGNAVRIVMKDVPDARPIVDFVWLDEDYRRQFHAAGLTLIDYHLPLGRAEESEAWISETSVAPWMIYVLRSDVGVVRSPAAPNES
jgi:SAM-dependent methyltransferase